MRLQDNPFLPADRGLPALVRQLSDLWRQLVAQLNGLTEGRITAVTNAAAAAPVAGEYLQGDQVRNVAPVEAGTPGSQYVVLGWVCIASGSPGTWVEIRALTGN